MIRTFLLLRWRSFMKYRWLVGLNILGFTAALTLFIFVAVFIRHELNYNQAFTHHKRIARLGTRVTTRDKTDVMSLSNAFAGPLLSGNFPEIENYTRLRKKDAPAAVQVANLSFLEQEIYEADASFFDIFDFQMAYGPANAFKENRYNVFISDVLNNKYFGGEDSQGSEIVVDGVPFVVGGVFVKNQTSDLGMDLLSHLDEDGGDEFSFLSTYLLFKDDNVDLNEFRQKIISPLHEKLDGEYNDDVIGIDFTVDALDQLHFSTQSYESFTPRSKTILFLLGGAAVMLLLSACFSYGSFNFALGFRRIREIILKRIFGATQASMFAESAAEVFLLLILSLAISILLFYLGADWLGATLETGVRIAKMFDGGMAGYCFLVLLIMGVLASAISFFLFTSKTGINVQTTDNKMRSQHALMVVQVTAGLSVLAMTVFMQRQISLLDSFDKGFNSDGIVAVPFPKSLTANGLAVARNELLQIGLETVSFCDASSLPGATAEPGLFHQRGAGAAEEFVAREMSVDLLYFKIFNIPLRADTAATDERGLIISENILSDKRLAKTDLGELNQRKVIGSAGNVFFHSLYQIPEPTVYNFDSVKYNIALIDVRTGWSKQRREQIGDIWKSVFGVQNFDYHFPSETYEGQHVEDRTLFRMLVLMSVSISIISLLGLVSVSHLTVRRRLREFSVRKVFGASDVKIHSLVVADTIKIFLVAMAASIPIVLILSAYWLSRYTIQAKVEWYEITALELTIAAVITCCSMLSVRKAIKNNPAVIFREN